MGLVCHILIVLNIVMKLANAIIALLSMLYKKYSFQEKLMSGYLV